MHSAINITKPLFLLLILSISNSNHAERFSFALIGDLPYGVNIGAKDKDTSTLFNNLNTHKDLSWVLHVGDIKTGGSSCSNAMLHDRFARFQAINAPFFYTPGDNEWTDCHRFTTGGFDPLERLAYLRTVFFDNEKDTLTRKRFSVIRQSDAHVAHPNAIENYQWQFHNVRFATIHIVGSQNGRGPFALLAKHKRSDAHDKALKERENAALSWLNDVFEQATLKQNKAVFIAIHANPALDEHSKDNRAAYAFFVKALAKHLKSFKKPVVLAHGDSHYFRIDKPQLNGRKAPKHFLRLESFGENNAAWVKVNVDPNSTAVFSFEMP